MNKKTGKVQVTGNKKQLEVSASYPVSFGLAVAALVHPHGEPIEDPATGFKKLEHSSC